MIESAVGLDASDALLISAKTGQGVPDVLEAIVQRIPPPKGVPTRHLQALIFDSGSILIAAWLSWRAFSRELLRKGQKIRLMVEWACISRWKTSASSLRSRLKWNNLLPVKWGSLSRTSRTSRTRKSGDTITDDDRPAIEPLPGFEDIKPMVFAGLYTVDAHEHTALREALEKLRLNDSSFFFEPESSVALGFGFRCGFLGLLHMEIIQERLEREYNLDLITTAPGVRYKVTLTDGQLIEVDNPSRWPDPKRNCKSAKSRSSSPSSSPTKNMSVAF